MPLEQLHPEAPQELLELAEPQELLEQSARDGDVAVLGGVVPDVDSNGVAPTAAKDEAMEMDVPNGGAVLKHAFVDQHLDPIRPVDDANHASQLTEPASSPPPPEGEYEEAQCSCIGEPDFFCDNCDCSVCAACAGYARRPASDESLAAYCAVCLDDFGITPASILAQEKEKAAVDAWFAANSQMAEFSVHGA